MSDKDDIAWWVNSDINDKKSLIVYITLRVIFSIKVNVNKL